MSGKRGDCRKGPGFSDRLTADGACVLVPGHPSCTPACPPPEPRCTPVEYCGAESDAPKKRYAADASAAEQQRYGAAAGSDDEQQGDADDDLERLAASDFNPTDDAKSVTRQYLLEWQWSFAGAAQNPEQVVWRVHQGMYFAFQKKPAGAEAGAKREGNLARALLLSGWVHAAQNTSPATLLVQMANMRGNRYTSSGKRAPFWILPNQNVTFQPPQMIFKPGDEIYSMRLKKYHNLTEEKICADIWGKPGSEYSFVPIRHPVSDVVRNNQRLLGVELVGCQQIDGNFKFHNDLIAKCQDTLRRQVLDHMPFTNLGMWHAKLERADGLPWDAAENVTSLAENNEVAHEIMTRTNVTNVVLELKFMLVPEGGAEAAAAGAP